MRSLGVNGQPTLVFDQLNGFAINITDQQAKRLQALGGVKSVEANAAVFQALVKPGETILGMARMMQAHPKLGILQSLVVGMPSNSAFARIFQFGMRHGMRPYTMGSAWWGGDCGPFWGHNALVRIVDVGGVVIERGERADGSHHDCHRMRVAAEALEESGHLLVHHRVTCHAII